MLDQTRTSLERDYNARCAEAAAGQRAAAEAANEILTQQEATALAIVLQTFPAEAVALAETIFESKGWPARALDEAWLDAAGQIVWRAAKIVRGV